MGTNPSIGAMSNFIKSQWSEFKFKSDEDCDNMLAAGPWMLVRGPIILKSWTSDTNLEKKGAEKVSIWIRIPHLSFQFWNAEMFSKIASDISTPLYADGATTDVTTRPGRPP
ncbi:hypothetical protein LIER_27188 [Lithospermum erythrorhizon]|uniref:DUF4283 domain-containing protein n=1 Tax=Lithospermum erythrorhizon TaxID=34254 RepID=A0AAV3REE6_LITER